MQLALEEDNVEVCKEARHVLDLKKLQAKQNIESAAAVSN